MVKKALSELVKRHKKNQADEKRLADAVCAYTQGQEGYTTKISFEDVAAEFNVSASTLRRRVNGIGMSMTEFNAKKQKLTVTEEKVLVTFILNSAQVGFPMAHKGIEQNANTILQAKHGSDYESVGKQWVFNFLSRHHKELQTHWSKPLDTQRARCLNPTAVESWFKIVEEFVNKMRY